MSFLLFLFFLSLFSPTHSSSPRLPIWPYPIAVSWPSPSAASLSPFFQILSPNSPLHLRIAARRYTRLLLSELHRPLAPLHIPLSSPPLHQLHISITDPTAPLHHGVDESYALYIPSSGAHANLTAHTPWGAIRGLETLSQLVWAEGTSSEPRVIATGVYIYDRPLFPHRGLLLDTARNYYPVKDVLRTVRAMGHNKMNVFHWHITDSQSFPIELPSEPRLAAEGAYGEGMKYSAMDVRRVVDYAMSFGIRVIPEIDAPGRTSSWTGAYPDLGPWTLSPALACSDCHPDICHVKVTIVLISENLEVMIEFEKKSDGFED